MRKKKVLIMGATSDEVAKALLKLSETCIDLKKSFEITSKAVETISPIQTKFGKGDRRKNKKQFMNQINRKR